MNKSVIKLASLAFLGATLSACKVQVSTTAGGSIATQSGSYQCTSGSACAEIEITTTNFDQTFVATPDAGFKFAGWRARDRSLCGGSTDSCRLVTSGFTGNSALLAFLSSDETFYLDAVFEQDANYDAQVVFNEFWNLFDRHYPLMFRKNIDWQEINDTESPNITDDTTAAQLATIIGDILSDTIRDGHTSATYQQQEFGFEPEGTAEQQRLQTMLNNTDALINYDASSVNNPYISFGTLKSDSDIGYIKSKVFEPIQDSDTEFTNFKQIVDNALIALANTKGIIVDVRTNGGGQGHYAYYLAGRFASDAPQRVVRQRYKTERGSTEASLSAWVVGTFEGYPDSRAEGGFIAPTESELNQFNASGDFQYANKVALLTSQNTASAAEFFTVAMKSQSQVRSFGDTTFGIFAGSEMVTLDTDKDWQIRLSVQDVEVNYQGDFQSFEGIGLQPDQVLYPTLQQVNAGQDIHIEAATAYINNTAPISPTPPVQSTSCNFSGAPSQTVNYDFDGGFDTEFINSSRWPSENATFAQENSAATLSANSSNTSQALEAWKLYKTPMPYNRSWQISATSTIPLFWNSNGGNDAQVGVGLFAGQAVASGVSSKVYETNMASINGGGRFAQAQLIANRLGEDPIDVQFVRLANSDETAVTSIRFCHSNKQLSYFVNGNQVGVSRAIDASGLDNWGVSDGDSIDVGIIGFAENTVIQSNSPTLDSFLVEIF